MERRKVFVGTAFSQFRVNFQRQLRAIDIEKRLQDKEAIKNDRRCL